MGTGQTLHLDPFTLALARKMIKQGFPNISDHFDVTSLVNDDYNCIAWAAGDPDRWWWPNPDRYWPEGVEKRETLESFVSAFATLGYFPCVDSDLEQGLEKVAIYCVAGVPKHMARQLRSGEWTSKLGSSWDIKHYYLQGVNCNVYGEPIQFLSRARVD